MNVNVSEKIPNHFLRGKWAPYAWALICVWLATLIRFPIQPVFGHASPFIFYFPVVFAIAAAFGLKPGLLATAASVLPADYFWMAPERAFSIDLVEACQVLAFSIAGSSVSFLGEAARKRKRSEEHMRATIANMSDAVITADRHGKIVYLNAMAQLLTEHQGQDAVGRTIGDALDLADEENELSLSASFQMAVKDDEIERLPERLVIVSKTGRRHIIEQKTSRILDSRGQKLGIAIVCRRAVSGATSDHRRRNGDPINAGSMLPRIAMVSPHGHVAAQPPLGAADTGGQVVYVLELAKNLAQLGYEVDIWTRRFGRQHEIERVADRVRIIRVPCGGDNFIPKEHLYKSLPQWNENALQLIKECRLRYEFVHSQYWDGGLCGEHLSRVLSVPHIHTPHSLGLWKKRQMTSDCPGDAADLETKYNFNERIRHERQIYSSADVIVATTPQQLSILSEDYAVPKEKCRMIPPGYDDTRFFPASDSTRRAVRKRLGFTGPVVQAIGRLADNKGYELLIKAFAIVAQRVPEALLHLAIGGSSLTTEEAMIFVRLRALVSELGLVEKVRFGNFIPDDELPNYYHAADVFVLSSRYEPFGMTAVEAMACGTPTVLTIHGGLHQTMIFGQDGLYADPFDPEDLGIMISKILKDPRLRSRLSQMGAQKARNFFTWTGVARQFITMVEQEADE